MNSARNRFFHTESFQLALIFGLVFSLLIAALAFLVVSLSEQDIRGQIVARAKADLTAVQNVRRDAGFRRAILSVQHRLQNNGPGYFMVLQQGEKKLAGNMLPVVAEEGVFVAGYGQRRLLGMGGTVGPDAYAFFGTDLRMVTSARQEIIRVLAWMVGGVLVLASAGGFFLSRRFLARTDAIARTCEDIMAGNLAKRIPLNGRQHELDRLAATINRMLDRISGLMANLERVTSDVAHDLRTPLSHLRQGLERARTQAGEPAAYAAALDRAIAASDHILALFSALLRIAQIEGGARRADFVSVKLEDILAQLDSMYRAVAEDAGHRLAVEASSPARIRGDGKLLFQMLSNLVENAIVHTQAGTRIEVTSRIVENSVRLCVSDDGPGIPGDEHEKVFQRFYRREASRTTPGHGLGLSLASAIAELHGGSLTIQSDGRHGLAIVATLPRET